MVGSFLDRSVWTGSRRNMLGLSRRDIRRRGRMGRSTGNTNTQQRTSHSMCLN